MLPCGHPGCSAVLTSRWSYTQHMKRHSGIFQYQCPYCDKGFSCTNGIKYHCKSDHTGLFGFHCNKCGQEFDKVKVLKCHLAQNMCSNENQGSQVTVERN